MRALYSGKNRDELFILFTNQENDLIRSSYNKFADCKNEHSEATIKWPAVLYNGITHRT